ncbi:MAG TPA: prolipoprotein diacylglyceryl transferase [Chloroflexota bacterium]
MIEIHIDPTMVALGPVTITWHGFFTAVGLVAGVQVASRLARGTVLTEEQVQSAALWAVIGGIVGARLLHVVDLLPYYLQNPLSVFAVTEGGLALWGAILGGVAGLVGYALVRRLPLALLADLGATGLVLGQGIGRIGDIINGEHHGTPTDLPWAVVYTHPNTLGEIGVPVHPAVGYEMLWDFAIFGLLLWALPRFPRQGMAFWTYLALYSLGRFVITFFRKDAAIVAMGLTQAQVISAFCFLLAVPMLVYLYGRAVREAARLSSRQSS